MIRELLSSKNLKSLRSGDSSRRSSGCFGRRMDRIGSMSSLGCNTVGRYSKYWPAALRLHGLNALITAAVLFSCRSKVKMKSYRLNLEPRLSTKICFYSTLFID